MADEPRRSGRAGKGQNMKPRDIPNDSPKKTKKGRATKKAVEEEPEDEEELIRCICGTYEEEEDVPRAMICCDNCSAWQHNECMGLPENYESEQYFCEQCRPEQHKELLEAIAKGEKPWEEAIRLREAAEADKPGKKKGKKGARKQTTAAAASTPQPQTEPDDTPGAKAAGQKRKAEETPVPEVKNKKIRGTPTAEADPPLRQPSRSDSFAGTYASNPKELVSSTRRGAASSLVKLFQDQVKEAVKKNTWALPTGVDAQTYGLDLGMMTEHILNNKFSYGKDEPGDEYKNQLRAISFNMKKNAALALRLINGELSPSTIATMDPKDMASKEQQQQDAELMKKMEKQHEIVEEQGPRIRKTHKGEEYVDESRLPQESDNSAQRRPPVSNKERNNKKSDGQETKTRQPLSVNTQAKGRPDQRRKSSSNFDIDRVFAGVQGSPDGETTRFPELQQRGSPPPQGAGTADPEIDNLLKDEDNESEPYSPKDFDEEGIVWKGVINGGSLGKFQTAAKHAAGARPEADTLRLTWNQVIPAEILIHGRIQPQKADEYLCGLQYSQTSDLIVVAMSEPKDATGAFGFDKFFNYLKNKERYGVGGQHVNAAIKDIYLCPMSVGQELPTFMQALVTDFPNPVRERLLLVPIVIKNSELPHNANTGSASNVLSPSAGPGVAQTPITPQDGQRDIPISGPVPYQNGGVISSNASVATSAAVRILGPQLARAQAVRQLCEQAPGAGDQEMRIVHECIQENPQAAHDLIVLTRMLTDRTAQGQQARAAQRAQQAQAVSQGKAAPPSNGQPT